MRLPFKPRRTVTDPSGEIWELYVTRSAPVRLWKTTGEGFDTQPVDAREAVADIPIALVSFLWWSILVPLLRLVVLAPVAAVRGRRSNAARILAVNFEGINRETRTWTTTVDQADSVLDEIAAALESGKVAQPSGAVYTGSVDD